MRRMSARWRAHRAKGAVDGCNVERQVHALRMGVVASHACRAPHLATAAATTAPSYHVYLTPRTPTCALQDERELLLWRGPPPETPPDYRYHVELPKFIPPTK